MPEADRKLFMREWIDTLEVYHPEDVRLAWQDYYRSDESFPDLKTIVGMIHKRRSEAGKRLALLKAEQAKRQEREEYEKRQAEIRADGNLEQRRARAKVIMETFKSKREETA